MSRRFARASRPGEAFEKIAGELSDAPSKANGGLIGPLTMTELAPALQKLLSGMKPGDISEPLRTPKGYQLLKLETMTPEEVLPPEQVRDQIAEKLYAAKREVELRKYLARMRKEAIIEWKNDELRKAYEAGLAADATATPAAWHGSSPRRRLPWRRLATDREPLVMSQAAPAQAPGATPRWFAVWTRSRHERAVFDQLTERGIEAFLPTTPRWSRWKDRTKKIDWPLFPGYCFARFAPASRLPVLKCAGVVSIVSFNGELAPVPDEARRRHPDAAEQCAALRSVSDAEDGNEGRSGARTAEGHHRPPAAKGRARPPRPVGRL